MIEFFRRIHKRVLFTLWLIIFAGATYKLWELGIPLKEYPDALHEWFSGFGSYGALLYILVYALRPLFIFPATLLTTISGVLFGPIGGILYTVIGENLSAGFAFWLARYFGQKWVSQSESKLIKKINNQVSQNGFMTALILRLIYLPFDLVNFSCGLSKMRYSEYALATSIGIMPGILIFVYFGSSWFDSRNLLISALIFTISFVIFLFVRKSKSIKILMNGIPEKNQNKV